MPVLSEEESKTLRAQVYDLKEKGVKQVLYGMIDILKHHPSVLTGVFIELVDDGSKFSRFEG